MIFIFILIFNFFIDINEFAFLNCYLKLTAYKYCIFGNHFDI